MQAVTREGRGAWAEWITLPAWPWAASASLIFANLSLKEREFRNEELSFSPPPPPQLPILGVGIMWHS